MLESRKPSQELRPVYRMFDDLRCLAENSWELRPVYRMFGRLGALETHNNSMHKNSHETC